MFFFSFSSVLKIIVLSSPSFSLRSRFNDDYKGEFRFIIDEEGAKVDIHSAEFAALPALIQHEIVAELTVRSRETSWKRLRAQLEHATTASDFSLLQVKNFFQTKNFSISAKLLHVCRSKTRCIAQNFGTKWTLCVTPYAKKIVWLVRSRIASSRRTQKSIFWRKTRRHLPFWTISRVNAMLRTRLHRPVRPWVVDIFFF